MPSIFILVLQKEQFRSFILTLCEKPLSLDCLEFSENGVLLIENLMVFPRDRVNKSKDKMNRTVNAFMLYSSPDCHAFFLLTAQINQSC